MNLSLTLAKVGLLNGHGILVDVCIVALDVESVPVPDLRNSCGHSLSVSMAIEVLLLVLELVEFALVVAVEVALKGFLFFFFFLDTLHKLTIYLGICLDRVQEEWTFCTDSDSASFFYSRHLSSETDMNRICIQLNP